MALKRHPFLLFGLPFVATIFFGSVYLAEFTQIRYNRRDEKVQMLDEEQALSIGQNKRRVDMKDEYYVRITSGFVEDFVANCVYRDCNSSAT